MKTILPLLLIIAGISSYAFTSDIFDKNEVSKTKEAGGIQFAESNWSKALEEAKKQHKPVFVDAYASWCGPCKLLKKKTFPDKAAGDFFNANFINIAIDMEKGDGPALSEKFNISAYPTLIITDENGNSLTYVQGYISASDLIEFGKFGLKQGKKQY